MRLKYKLTYLLILLLILPALAHEFWLEPQQYIFSRTDEINIRFRVGESFTSDNWKGSREKINELKLYYADIVDDLSDAISDEEGDSLQFSIHEEGTAVVTFNNTNSFIELEAEKFNAYLSEDGLQSAIDYRKQHNETDSPGCELYQRSVKTIVQVGALKTAVFKKQTTLPVDIIPLSHPYQLKNGDSLTVKIFFKNEPLVNSKIRVWHKLMGRVVDTSFMSNEKGEISFTVSTTGEWMVSCVQMIRLTDDPKAQWQSYWGSLTWGYTGKNKSTIMAR
ncbi:DUF4198 domain-containing protein [Lacibacter sediminis]|uniref:DUF4198 domain-containing protein n=1 Tax=Lacibacter sediminis TaxID=2760713 RepID=A0A7G5XIK9_9BACT|nr:DUF4198 domain-containing protein [Lacibacter sediminis]QNA45312.1 DUF4198 domain-containing protein [Lacibacter sediminis]